LFYSQQHFGSRKINLKTQNLTHHLKVILKNQAYKKALINYQNLKVNRVKIKKIKVPNQMKKKKKNLKLQSKRKKKK